MRVIERTAPMAAVMAALTALACCLPLSFLGAGLAGAVAWTGAYRGWFLALAVILLVTGFIQIYRGRQCRKRSIASVTLFWLSVAIVLVILFFPQVIGSILAG